MTHSENNFNWDIIDSSSFPGSRTEKALENVMGRARMEAPRHRRRAMIFRWMATAAVLIMLPALTLFISGRLSSPAPESATMLTASAANGQVKTVYLPDSTKVVLNSGSTLFYPDSFSGNDRRVCLSGEAVFDVTHDKKRPFFVSTADITVKVLGTLFDVQAYPEEGTVSTTLCRGSVGILCNGLPDDSMTMLHPGEEFKMRKSDGSFVISKVEPEDVSVWENGGICLNAGDIHDLVHMLERQFNVNIYLTSDKYDSEKITAKFTHGESIDEILKVVSSLLPGMTYNTINTNIYIH